MRDDDDMRPDGLPNVVTLRRWRSVHELDTGSRMIGLDPTAALVVDDLAPALAELIPELRSPVTPAEFAARAGARGVAAQDAYALLGALHTAGELVDGAALQRAKNHRAAAAVVVQGTGPLTVGVAVGLVAAGIGAVRVVTSGTVTGADLGTGLGDADRGRPRLAAIGDAAARVAPGTTVTSRPRTLVPDLVVLADEYPDPVTVDDLLATGLAHLPVRLRDGIGVVGPLVLPGRTACLSCLDLQRSACNPNWPMVAAQLAGRRGEADPACAQATAALAVAQVTAAIDATAGGTAPPPALEASIELDAASATIVRRTWLAVPDCRCRATELLRAQPGGGATIVG
ncbi:MAG: TOMM precursor leader peptide-binding protein [Pseudonocardia sp.]|nr:TOMM precursor leader peptide-binding protein [Pseudonocardia sp.]